MIQKREDGAEPLLPEVPSAPGVHAAEDRDDAGPSAHDPEAFEGDDADPGPLNQWMTWSSPQRAGEGLDGPPGSEPFSLDIPGDVPVPPPSPPPRRPAGALDALGVGWARVRERTRLWLFIWMTSLLAALIATVPALVWLNANLERRPAALRLARGEADALFIELLGDATGVPMALLAIALFGTLLHWLLHVLLSGGVISALRRTPSTPHSISQILGRAGETAGAMFRLELAYIGLVRVPLLVLVLLVALLVGRGLTLQALDLPALLRRFGPLLGLAFLSWSMASVSLNVARTVRLAQVPGQMGTLRAVGTALRRCLLSFSGLRAVVALALTSLLGTGALLLIGRVAAAQLDYMMLVAAAFVVRQVVALVRTMLALLVMAGATAIADGAD